MTLFKIKSFGDGRDLGMVDILLNLSLSDPGSTTDRCPLIWKKKKKVCFENTNGA